MTFSTRTYKRKSTDRSDLDWVDRRRRLGSEWRELVRKYAPHAPSPSSIWRYSFGLSYEHPDQGWKIHISGTLFNASEILGNIIPILSPAHIVYKVPKSLDELIKINAGIFYGYSQIGKFVTVYPKNDDEFRRLAGRLHEATDGLESPEVPFDFRFADRSCVYFRYGKFKTPQLGPNANSDNSLLTAPDGTLIPDDRCRANYLPSWEGMPPIRDDIGEGLRDGENAFNKRYCVFKSIVQRGKGGIYEAIDMRRGGRHVIIKQGRAQGELDWDGSDGIDRLRREAYALAELRNNHVPVPEIFGAFGNDGNSYLVLEKIEGVTLQALVDKRFKYLTFDELLVLSLEIAKTVSRIHDAGWVWRDCKPANLLILPTGRVRPIDFEGARQVDHPSTLPWASKGFASPETLTSEKRDSNLPEDLYALGATLHFLLTGTLPQRMHTTSKNIPKHLAKTITALLDPNPNNRPNTESVMLDLSLRREII